MKIHSVYFGGGRTAKLERLTRYDYGQFLRFEDIELPDVYEVHFCNEGDQTTKTELGGHDGVRIPDEYLQTGKKILVFLYLHAEYDDGTTVYKITIPVEGRPGISEDPPTEEEQGIVAQTIAALNIAVRRAESAQAGAETAEANALASAETAANSSAAAAESAHAAADSAHAAADSAEAAAHHAQAALASRTAANGSAAEAAGKASQASGYAEAAGRSASAAAASADAANEHELAAREDMQAAAGSARAADLSANASAASATAAANSAAAAEASVNAGGYILADLEDEMLTITLVNIEDITFYEEDERLVMQYE